MSSEFEKAPPSTYLQVGYVCRAHGLNGELAVKTFDPASEVLFDVEHIQLKRRDGELELLEVIETRTSNKELLLHVKGVTSRVAAEKRIGSTVFVLRDEIDAPEEGEFFQGDLVGLTAVDEVGNVLGQVEELWDFGAVPNLVIRGGAQGELMVPFADEFVPEVRIETGQIVVRPLQYLNEKNQGAEGPNAPEAEPDAEPETEPEPGAE